MARKGQASSKQVKKAKDKVKNARKAVKKASKKAGVIANNKGSLPKKAPKNVKELANKAWKKYKSGSLPKPTPGVKKAAEAAWAKYKSSKPARL